MKQLTKEQQLKVLRKVYRDVKSTTVQTSHTCIHIQVVSNKLYNYCTMESSSFVKLYFKTYHKELELLINEYYINKGKYNTYGLAALFYDKNKDIKRRDIDIIRYKALKRAIDKLKEN